MYTLRILSLQKNIVDGELKQHSVPKLHGIMHHVKAYRKLHTELKELSLIKFLSLPVLIVLCSFDLMCQQLSSSDSLYAINVRTELALSQNQIFKMDSIMRSFANELVSIEKENQRNSRSSISQVEKDSIQTQLLENKKQIKSAREISIRSLFTPEQNILYDTKIKPGKPAVIHMGINHDRVNCTVCLPK